MHTVPWGSFLRSAPDLARHVEARLGGGRTSYLATVRADGWPRVHPVGAKIRGDQLVVVMYPASPKGRDIRSNGLYALHCGVEDNQGGQGEVLLTGEARPIEPTSADVEQGWVAFELLIGELLATRYDELGLKPVSTRWRPGDHPPE